MKPFQKFLLLAGILSVWLVVPGAYGGITFTTLISFNNTNGATPVANLVPGPNGNFFGTAPNGGAYSSGTIFEISPDGSFFTNFYNFSGGSNGAAPAGALVLGTDGNYYGTTYSGGMSNWGTIFQISTNGAFNQLGLLSGTNGAHPNVALVQAADGSFYGTTKYGGPYPNTTSGGTGYGVIFRITTNGAISTPVLLAGTNGAYATALARGSDGNFYGTTAWGGNTSLVPWGVGTIFKLSPDGTFTNLYKFTGGNDGGFAYANLVQGSDGNFYGAAFSGGAHSGGSLFRITPDGTFTNLYSFTDGSDGGSPYSALVQGSDGNFYGTTYSYGSRGVGTIFQMTTNGNVTPLISFTGTSGSYLGANEQGSLVQGPDGNFYGTTPNGGIYNDGTVFRLSLPLPPVFKSAVNNTGMVTLVWSSVASQSYQLQYTTNLALPVWTNVGGSVPATNGTMTASDSPGTDPQRFYRVMLQ
ncbi:MAG TPA: choice-of-anchor tandem repeat GloVer-containing protein [Verrucomicrobiae bacterium]|nr:choice-of-anchor tandem repeat GloVer-containing protein [Verrucomicrobiae bacterium]